MPDLTQGETTYPVNRRELCAGLTGLASLGALIAACGLSAEAQTAATAEAPGGPSLVHSQIFSFDQLPVHAMGDAGASRSVLHGTLGTGEFVEVHETALSPGRMPHPPHRHTHSEFLLIREGKLEVVSEGQRGVVTAGGVVFTASGVLHSLRNIGDSTANYFVVAVGAQRPLP